MTKKLDPGKQAEKDVDDWLGNQSRFEWTFAYHRFPDARAARGALAAQPSDFLVCRKPSRREPETVFLEVKETAEQRRLPKANVSQYGKLKMFDVAGARVIVLVKRSAHGDWTFFRGRDLFHHDDTPTSFAFEGRPTFATAADALQEIFK